MWHLLLALAASLAVQAQGNDKVREDPAKGADPQRPPVTWSVPGEREFVPRTEEDRAGDAEGSWIGMTEPELIELLGPPTRVVEDSPAAGKRTLFWGLAWRPDIPTNTGIIMAPEYTPNIVQPPVLPPPPGMNDPYDKLVPDPTSCRAQVSVAGIVERIGNRRRCHPLDRNPVAVARVRRGVHCDPGSGVELVLLGDDSSTGPGAGTSGSLSYEWTSLSGSSGEQQTLGTTSSLAHVFPPGDHEVRLRVTDLAGRSDTSVLELAVPGECGEDLPVAKKLPGPSRKR